MTVKQEKFGVPLLTKAQEKVKKSFVGEKNHEGRCRRKERQAKIARGSNRGGKGIRTNITKPSADKGGGP